MDADYDGPCAVPQPDSIQESMADPLAVFGFALIASSLLMLAYTGTGERHRRYGCQEILDFSSAVCLNILIISLQRDNSGSAKPPIDIKRKVPL